MKKSQIALWQSALPAGWSHLFLSLAADLAEVDPKFQITDAMQKFGTMRVRLLEGSKKSYQLIDAANLKSASTCETCETCGSEGRLFSTKGYYHTVCDAHADKDSIIAASNPTITFRVLLDPNTDALTDRLDRLAARAGCSREELLNRILPAAIRDAERDQDVIDSMEEF